MRTITIDPSARYSRAPRPCPGCKRSRLACWQMACLYLEVVKRRGPAAVASWLRAGLGLPKSALTVSSGGPPSP